MRRIEFTIAVAAHGQERARHGVIKTKDGRCFSNTYKSKKQRSKEKELYAAVLPFAPKTPIEGPVRLEIEVFENMPTSWSKKKKSAMMHDPNTSKPDISNIVKHIEDVFNGLFWRDDAQVYCLSAAKYWGDSDMIKLEISWR